MNVLALVGGALLFFVLILLFILILYVITLIRQARKGQYIWFVLTLVIAPLMFVYWIVKLFGGVK